MLQENLVTILAANLASLPFRLSAKKPFKDPEKILILKPGDLVGVMEATPLLSVLRHSFPQARIDWAIADPYRQAIAGNPNLSSMVRAEPVTEKHATWTTVRSLIDRIRRESYDTCYIPDKTSLLSYVAWQAGIQQRIGLNLLGRGFAHSIAVRPDRAKRNRVEINLELARSTGSNKTADMEFFPTDDDRIGIMARLTSSTTWDNILPLVMVYPGYSDTNRRKKKYQCWPAERYAFLTDRLVKKYGATVVLAGASDEQSALIEMVEAGNEKLINLAGQLSLGELGALCEIADLYIGNDDGVTYIAAAVGAPTVAIFGPTDPVRSGLVAAGDNVHLLKADASKWRFSWEGTLAAEEVFEAADNIIGETRAAKN